MLKDSVEIKSTPEKIFEFFESWEKNYRRWHPNHGDSRWLKGNLNEPGSILYTEEILHGHLHKLKFRITEIEPPSRLSYKFLFPWSLFISKGSFVIERKKNRCLFTSSLTFRFARLLKTFAKRRMADLKQHMKEEGDNLKRIIESDK
ncbi:MAG: hypothetical protein GTO17_06875 [Candidatus Aminicenantes bacterium]|nr:hypothetical protein [Candidatus Aminicenantes bacterium]